MLLTASGMYGVRSFLVGKRRKEMGIRLALGAASRTLARHMLSYSARLVVLGVSLGLVLALWGAQLISAQTRFIYVYDLPAYVLGSAVVAVAAVMAALIPALRTARVDPAEALRAE